MNDIYLRSCLFIPANNPGMIQSSTLLEADAIVYDLEDAVSINQKDSARYLLSEAFTFFSKNDIFRIVRVNPFDTIYYEKDVEMVLKYDVDAILLAKGCVESVIDLASKISDKDTKIIVLIESAHSLLMLREIILASNKVIGVLFGAEDYATDMGIERTKDSDEIIVARQTIAYVCKALKVFAIDTPFTDIEDFEGLIKDTKKAKSYGYMAKAAINPRQVYDINKVIAPSKIEVIEAYELIDAYHEALAQGMGVFNYKGKMVDAPIVNRALSIVKKAEKAGVTYE